MFKMFRRFFWLVFGFALGATSSWALSRRVKRVADRYVPSEIRDRWTGTVKAAVGEGRVAMKAREAELKGDGRQSAAK